MKTNKCYSSSGFSPIAIIVIVTAMISAFCPNISAAEEKPDLIFMGVSIGLPEGGGYDDYFDIYYGSGLNADGSVDQWKTDPIILEGFGKNNTGGGAAIGYINDNDTPDLISMGICDDDASGDNFWYRVIWDIDPKGNGQSTKWTEKIKVDGFCCSQDGGGAAIGYINDNWKPDLIFMRINDAGGPNKYCYKIGWDLNEKGIANWSDNICVDAVDWEQEGGGAALAYLDDDDKPDLILMGVADPGPDPKKANVFHWMICSDLDENGTASKYSRIHKPNLEVYKETQGAGADIAYVDGDAIPDLIFMTIDGLDTNNRFRYTIARDLDETGEITKGWDSIYSPPIARVGWKHGGGGVAVVRPLTKLQLTKPQMGSNNKVNFAKDGDDFTFELKATTPRKLGRDIIYRCWIAEEGKKSPLDLKYKKESPTTNTARIVLQGLDPGDYEVYFQAIDHFASRPLKVPVKVWARPGIPQGCDEDGVDWSSQRGGYFFGEKGEPVRLKARVEKPNGNVIEKYIWDLGVDKEGERVVKESKVHEVVTYTFPSGFGSEFKCIAESKYGIQSEEQTFTLQLYDPVEVDPRGPYDGLPGRRITLKGEIKNLDTKYEDYKSTKYQWLVSEQPGLEFDGVDDQVVVEEYEGVVGTGARTVAAWIKTTSTGKSSSIVHWGPNETGRRWTLRVNSNSTLGTKGAIRVDVSGGHRVGSTNVCDGEWHHVAVVLPELTGPNVTDALLYVDGQLEEISGENSCLIDTAGDCEDCRVKIGGYSSGNFFDGSIDDVSIWKCALSVEDIEDLKENPIAKNIRIQEGLVSYWAFDEGTGMIAEDSVYDNDGTINGATWPQRSTELETDDKDGSAKHTWENVSRNAVYVVELQATVETLEGLSLTGSDVTTVAIQAGVPIACIGGPYKGGIEGGSFSPIHFEGNPRGVEFDTSDVEVEIVEWEWTFDKIPRESETEEIRTEKMYVWNPTQFYPECGTYDVSLRVMASSGRSSSPKTTTVTVVDGEISGVVKAADLRTPVGNVRLTLTSSHVHDGDLSSLAPPGSDLKSDGKGGVYTHTSEEDGSYVFPNLPLGSYRVVASRIDNEGKPEQLIHEFGTEVRATELTLNSPDQQAMDFVDLSVYPVGGKVYYSIKKGEEEVYVEDVMITAQPIGSTSLIEGLPSTKDKDQNYTIPLFAGKYVFLAKRGGHDVRLIGTQPSDPDQEIVGDPPYGYENGVLTIKAARNDIHFIDYTTRKITVYVEDSGGYPIDKVMLEDQEVTIRAETNGDNGYAEGPLINDGENTYFEATVPPGEYTVTLPNLPAADVAVKDNKSSSEAKVDVRVQEEASVTMIIKVPIELKIGPEPKLMDEETLAELEALLEEYEVTLADLGIDKDNNPEGFMYYIPDEDKTQKHTYTITAWANGRIVEDFKLNVTDNVSIFTDDEAPEKQYPGQSDGCYDETEVEIETEDEPVYGVEYTVSGGLPKMTVINESDPRTYMQALDGEGDPMFDEDGNPILAPVARPKKINFWAEKDGYKRSVDKTLYVTVLGDVSAGGASELVSIPNVNYLVLHDPPGDGSYSFIDDSLEMTGIIHNMHIRPKSALFGAGGVTVYPTPWSKERNIMPEFGLRINFDDIAAGDHDLGDKGLLDNRVAVPAEVAFGIGGLVESGKGYIMIGAGLVGGAVALQLVDFVVKVGAMSPTVADFVPEIQPIGFVQYEISPSRHLETPAGGNLPDVMGPGKGDVYYGQGITLALQMKYRLGIRQNPNSENLPDDAPNYIDPLDLDPDTDHDESNWPAKWLPNTKNIPTYTVLQKGNQYSYTVDQIEIIKDGLDEQIALLDKTAPDYEDKKSELEGYRNTWVDLLEKNPAYIWQRDYINGDNPSDREALEAFIAAKSGSLGGDGELLMFSAGPSYSYSRKIRESQKVSYSSQLSVSTDAAFAGSLDMKVGAAVGVGVAAISVFGGGSTNGSLHYGSSQGYGVSLESGSAAEQTVGFILHDDDVGDRITTYVYEGPWGTPIFFTDPGSVTSDPWEPNTNKGVDVTVEWVQEPENLVPFDYQAGAHYKLRINYTGMIDLESVFSTTDFLLYAPQTENTGSMTVRFNGKPEPYLVGLTKEAPSATIALSLYPPEIDQNNSHEKGYEFVIQAQEVADAQISKLMPSEGRDTVNFADLRAPKAVIATPYEGQRLSPAVFTEENPFKIQVSTEDMDVARIQLKRRTRDSKGVWGSPDSSGMPCWVDANILPDAGCDLGVVEILPYPNAEAPTRKVFTFKWPVTLGEGEYAICAVAADRATFLNASGEQELRPNEDPDPAYVTFRVDSTEPEVLTTIPDYQARESERMYRGELSVTFTDDMKADSINSDSFVVTNLEDQGPPVAGFISYSPTLRKAAFVPVQPFKPNGYYRAEVKKDDVCDLAGNPLGQDFTWTFRTPNSPFEETWEIALKVTDGISTDSNNMAGVAHDAEDGEDEKDARSVPGLTGQLRLNFVDQNDNRFDRDFRPADGRLSHHWFFEVESAIGNTVELWWKPSTKLLSGPAIRQYKHLWLTEFAEEDVDGDGSGDKWVERTKKKLSGPDNPDDPSTVTPGEYKKIHEYANDGEIHYFRLNVQKLDFVAGKLSKGTSNWKFFSVPVDPESADPFVNFGDDIDPFKLYQYNSNTKGFKIYPLDLGEVALQRGHAYFTWLESDVVVDVGGSMNSQDVTLRFETAGWHAIGNPFILPVRLADLKVNDMAFGNAGNLVQSTLYQWGKGIENGDTYLEVKYDPGNPDAAELKPWEGYWFETKTDDVTLTIPAPADVGDAGNPLPDSYYPPMAAPSDIAKGQHLEGGIPAGFDLKLALTSSFAADVITALGTHPGAQMGLDSLDASEPPILSQTVAAYFDRPEWGGLYNTDYQPPIEVGEVRTWQLVAFTDRRNARMDLSWASSIENVPDNLFLSFRRESEEEWKDMRKVRSVEIIAKSGMTRVPFEVRAERFAMSLPADIQVLPGEAQVEIRWKAEDNRFIESYYISRMTADNEQPTVFALKSGACHYVDTDVEEEETYTYRISVRFITGAELHSDLFIATVLPVIKETALLQNYPNPFNPETWIPYELAEDADVSVEIYTVGGQLVRHLALGSQKRGRYVTKQKAAYWDGRNEAGEISASGTYFYVLRAGDSSAVRKMVVFR